MIFYHMKSILKDQAREIMEVHFSVVFYERNPKNKKISFLVTKSGQNLDLTIFYRRTIIKLCIFTFFNKFWTIFFLMIRSHGFDGLFAAFDVACITY